MKTADSTLLEVEHAVSIGNRPFQKRLSANWLLAAGVTVAWLAGSVLLTNLDSLPPPDPAAEKERLRALDVATPESVAELGKLIGSALRRSPR